MSDALWQVLVVVLVVVAIIQATALIAILRQVGGLLVRLNPTGVADIDQGPDVDTLVELPGVPAGRPALVVFASPTCTLCRYLEAAIPAVQSNYAEIEVVVAIIGSDDEEQRLRYGRRFGDAGRPDLVSMAKEWNVEGTPFAVGLDAEHRVRVRGVANTLDHLESAAEVIVLPPLDPEAEERVSADATDSALGGRNGNVSRPALERPETITHEGRG